MYRHDYYKEYLAKFFNVDLFDVLDAFGEGAPKKVEKVCIPKSFTCKLNHPSHFVLKQAEEKLHECNIPYEKYYDMHENLCLTITEYQDVAKLFFAANLISNEVYDKCMDKTIDQKLDPCFAQSMHSFLNNIISDNGDNKIEFKLR